MELRLRTAEATLSNAEALRIDFQRTHMALGSTVEKTRALADAAGRVATTWEAFPTALQAGNAAPAVAMLGTVLTELLAAVQGLSGGGASSEEPKDRGDKRGRAHDAGFDDEDGGIDVDFETSDDECDLDEAKVHQLHTRKQRLRQGVPEGRGAASGNGVGV